MANSIRLVAGRSSNALHDRRLGLRQEDQSITGGHGAVADDVTVFQAMRKNGAVVRDSAFVRHEIAFVEARQHRAFVLQDTQQHVIGGGGRLVLDAYTVVADVTDDALPANPLTFEILDLLILLDAREPGMNAEFGVEINEASRPARFV